MNDQWVPTRFGKCIAAAATVLLAVTCSMGAGATYYVAPKGNDAWSGLQAEANAARSDGPVATLDRARQLVRARIAKGPNEPITVQIHGGEFTLEPTVVFGPEDAGTKDENHDNIVTNNLIHHVGEIYWHSPGIFIAQSGHNLISHNTIHDLGYNGMVISGCRPHEMILHKPQATSRADEPTAFPFDPVGPFTKHPLNPIMNSGHETALFPFMGGIAAFAIHNGIEHNTIQYAPDGVNFRIAAVSSLMPVAAGPYVPDAFTDTKDGRGITWGLCHITGVGERDQRHSILARFDCDLSRDVNDPAMKQTDLYLKPEAYFSQGLNKRQREQREKAARRQGAS